jgi:hypothetical protein
LTSCLAEEYKKRNISIFCLRLGLVDAGMGLHVKKYFENFPIMTIDSFCERFLAIIKSDFQNIKNGDIITIEAE